MENVVKVAKLDERGHEVVDSTPLELPAGFERPESLEEMVRRLVKSEELASAANNADVDTFEEAEDFEIDDDSFDPHSPYEEVFDPVLGRGITPEEFHRNQEVYEKRYREAYDRAYQELLKSTALRAVPRRKADAPSSPPPEGGGRKEGEKS